MEYLVFELKTEYKGKANPQKTVGVVIADTTKPAHYIKGAWYRAVRETAEKLEPNYSAAVKWLQAKHPEWTIVETKAVYPLAFELTGNTLFYDDEQKNKTSRGVQG